MTDEDKKLNSDAEEEIRYEEDEDIVAEGNIVDKLKELRKKFKESEREKGEYLSGWQRAKADFINARREEDERRGEVTKFAERKLVEEFLTVADSFDALVDNEKIFGKIDESAQVGIQNTYGQLVGILAKHGLEKIEAKGKKFDYFEHEAIGTVDIDKNENEGIVIEESRKGYKLNGRVIRPTQVKIGKIVTSNE